MRGPPPEPRRKVPFTKPHKHRWQYAHADWSGEAVGALLAWVKQLVFVCECGAIKLVKPRQLTKLEKRGAEK